MSHSIPRPKLTTIKFKGTIEEWRLEYETIGVYEQTNLIGKISGDTRKFKADGTPIHWKDVTVSQIGDQYLFSYLGAYYVAYEDTKKEL